MLHHGKRLVSTGVSGLNEWMLYVVGTPIGHLQDISLRALETLRTADLIAAEDTRHSLRLLQRHEISKPLISYHEHNEASRTPELLEKLRSGQTIALITDAGMPSVSDPGRRLVAACIEAGLPYSIIPGPSAVLTALAGSGFATYEWYFGGFLPIKSGGRERELRRAVAREYTSLFFESPHRLVKTLAVLEDIAPHRRLCVARELTKQFEEYRQGTAATLRAHYEKHPPKGEITFLLDALTKQERKEASGTGPERDI